VEWAWIKLRGGAYPAFGATLQEIVRFGPQPWMSTEASTEPVVGHTLASRDPY
jgi:hypothetical protein